MENNCAGKTACPVQSCLCKLLCFALPTFIILLAAGFVVHHVWLMPVYKATASLWRPAADMEQFFPWVIGNYAILSIIIAGLFARVRLSRKILCQTMPEQCQIGGKKCPIKHGVTFGVLIGLLMGTMAASSYIWTPIPGELAVDWFIAWTIQGAIIGAALGAIGHCKDKKYNEAK